MYGGDGNTRHRFRALWLLLLAAGPARAGFFEEYLRDPEDGQLDASRYLSEVPLGFLPVPAVISEPAVGYGLAVGAVFFHESAEQRRHRTSEGVLLPENISVVGLGGTENGTWFSGLGHLGFWHEDTLRYRGFLGYGSINLNFYSLPGVGELPGPVELNLEGPFLLQELKYRLSGSSVFLGARQMYRGVETRFESLPGPASLPPPVQEWFDGNIGRDPKTSGLGVIAEYDSRDNPFDPQRGYYYSTYYVLFDDAIGSDVDYDSFNVSALNYWVLNEHFNLALRLQLDGVGAAEDQQLPAYVPPYIDLRGVPASRYQGNRVAVAEIQVDYKLNPRWKLGVFTGGGRAAAALDELGSAERVHSYGAGFRYLVARRYGFVMGIDVARGPDDTAVYIKAGSTW